MHKLLLTALLLTCVLATSGCVRTGKDVKPPPACPQPPPLPQVLATPPNYGEQVRALLFDSPTSATPTCADCSGPTE